MKLQIRLDTQRDVNNFVHAVSNIPYAVTVTDNKGLRVNGKSVIGMLYSLEFAELWCECEEDIYHTIKEFVVDL